MLPYWPGSDAPIHSYVRAFWAVHESVNAGFEAPEGLRDKLAGALKKIVNGQAGSSRLTKLRALRADAIESDEDFSAVSQDLYLRRNETGDEGRACWR